MTTARSVIGHEASEVYMGISAAARSRAGGIRSEQRESMSAAAHCHIWQANALFTKARGISPSFQMVSRCASRTSHAGISRGWL